MHYNCTFTEFVKSIQTKACISGVGDQARNHGEPALDTREDAVLQNVTIISALAQVLVELCRIASEHVLLVDGLDFCQLTI